MSLFSHLSFPIVFSLILLTYLKTFMACGSCAYEDEEYHDKRWFKLNANKVLWVYTLFCGSGMCSGSMVVDKRLNNAAFGISC